MNKTIKEQLNKARQNGVITEEDYTYFIRRFSTLVDGATDEWTAECITDNVEQLNRIVERYTAETKEVKAIPDLTKEELKELRDMICLCSLYYSDYVNGFGIDKRFVCDFFDGYAEYLGEKMQEDGHSEEEFFDLLDEYDTPERLQEWQYCIEYTQEDIAEMTRENRTEIQNNCTDEIYSMLDDLEDYVDEAA